MLSIIPGTAEECDLDPLSHH